MFTPARLESVRAARLQLLDLGDTKTAKTLDWVVLALGCLQAGITAQESPALLVADLLDHINELTERLGDRAPEQRDLMSKVNAWLERRDRTPDEQILAARAEGRGEVLSMILDLDPEDGLGEYTFLRECGATGEFDIHWDEAKLREFFRADASTWDLQGRLEEQYWERRGLRMQAADLVRDLRAARARAHERDQVQAQPQAPAIFLVATGVEVEGEETYTRHEGAPPPLCDFEGPLYAKATPACSHRFMHFGDQPRRRCADCSAPEPVALTDDPRVAEVLRECELFLRVLGLDSEPAAKLANEARAALAASQPAPAAETLPAGVVVSAYRFNEQITIQRMSQIDGPDLWAVRNRFSEVLNAHGEWEREPMPSSRDDAFLTRCRYLSSGAAIAAALQREAADRNSPKEQAQ